ncbi:MAG: hypothetical protein OXC99_03030 [Chloroflexi bacterium]|nr:hypothetical protein [Chloroflexota bacterium]
MAQVSSTDTPVPDATTTSAGLFGDDESSAPAAGAADEHATVESTEAEQDAPDANTAEASPGDAGTEAAAAEELKVVVSVQGERAVIGVRRTGADPHIEAFDGRDLPALAREVPAVVERARARWEESPKHPAHTRPAPAKTATPAKRRQRGAQAQSESQAPQDGAEQQPEALRLF